MNPDLAGLNAFLAVARARGSREASRTAGVGASTLSEAVRRLEASLGVRLLHRTTRSVTATEAGARLLERLAPALAEVAAALDAVDDLREGVTGTLRLNMPISAERLVLPTIMPSFLAARPGVKAEIVAEDGLVDVLASGCDAGIRYDERLEQDMIAIPIGPGTAFRYGCLLSASGQAWPPRAPAGPPSPPLHPRSLRQRSADLPLGVRARGRGDPHRAPG